MQPTLGGIYTSLQISINETMLFLIWSSRPPPKKNHYCYFCTQDMMNSIFLLTVFHNMPLLMVPSITTRHFSHPIRGRLRPYFTVIQTPVTMHAAVEAVTYGSPLQSRLEPDIFSICDLSVIHVNTNSNSFSWI